MDADTIFYDIGANIGYYSLALANNIKTGYLFEPNPVLCERISFSIKENSISNLVLYNFGIGSTNSKLNFYYSATRHDIGSFIKPEVLIEKAEVEVRSLDEIANGIAPAPDVIKMDTEGLELEILESFSSLTQIQPIILMEWQPDRTTENVLFKRLQKIINNEYQVFSIGIDEKITPYNHEHQYACNLLLMPINHKKLDLIKSWL